MFWWLVKFKIHVHKEIHIFSQTQPEAVIVFVPIKKNKESTLFVSPNIELRQCLH